MECTRKLQTLLQKASFFDVENHGLMILVGMTVNGCCNNELCVCVSTMVCFTLDHYQQLDW